MLMSLRGSALGCWERWWCGMSSAWGGQAAPALLVAEGAGNGFEPGHWLLAGINQLCLVQHSCVIEIRSRSGSDLPPLLVKLPSLRTVWVHLRGKINESQCSSTKSIQPYAGLSGALCAAGQGKHPGKSLGQLRDPALYGSIV